MKTPLDTEVDLGPGHIVLDGDPASRERGTAASSFRSMSIVATVTHLSYCRALVQEVGYNTTISVVNDLTTFTILTLYSN